MTTPTDVLRAEHELILKALDTVETAARALDAGVPVPDDWWAAAVAWLRGFADTNHHAKEEDALFPAMVAVGVPSEGGPVGVMLYEHTQGRALIRAIEEGGDRARSAKRYVDLLRGHIAKENEVLFPLADAVLPPETQHTLADRFDTVAIELGTTASLTDAARALDALAGALSGTLV
jgi:hemerythrin-like domain-containing protein